MPFWLSILLFSILISPSELRLPEGFYRVPSCPTPDNLTAWKERSAALNCTDDLENEDPGKLTNIYNCMPSNYLNETVEFCGPMTAISEGNCPVLNYEHKATAPTGRPCSSFTDGCPSTLFFTREIYKYSACLKINTRRMCYFADPECPKNAKRESSSESFPTNITTASLITTTEFMTDDHPKHILSTEIIIVIIILSVVSFLLIVILIVLIKCLGWRKIIAFLVSKMRNKTPRKQSVDIVEMERMLQEKDETADEKTDNVEMESMLQEKDETADGKIRIKTGTKENKQNVTKDKEMGEDLRENFLSYGSEDSQNQKVESSLMPSGPLKVWESDTENRLLFNNFYFDIAKKIIDRDFMQNFSILLQDNTVENTVNQRQKFAQWSKEYNFQRNIWHLQELLKKCGALDLVEECAEFAERCPSSVVFFRSNDTLGENRELLILHTNLDKSQKTVCDEMEKIRCFLQKVLHCDVKLCGVNEGSLILEFSVPKENVKDIDRIDLSSIWPLKVFKIETNAWIISPDLKISKSNLKLYVHVELHYNKIQDRLKLLFLAINDEIKAMGLDIKTDGHNIKCKFWKQSCAQGRRLIEDKSSLSFEKEILENMEPSIVKGFLKNCLPGYHSEIEDIFIPTKSRKQTAKDILLFLSGKKHKVFKHSMNCVIDMYKSKEIPTCEIRDGKDSAMTEDNGLFENTELLLDEIDSSIIDATFDKIGDVPSDVVQKCSSGSGRKRKERAKTFYDFVNRNEDHFQIFKSILQSNTE